MESLPSELIKLIVKDCETGIHLSLVSKSLYDKCIYKSEKPLINSNYIFTHINPKYGWTYIYFLNTVIMRKLIKSQQVDGRKYRSVRRLECNYPDGVNQLYVYNRLGELVTSQKKENEYIRREHHIGKKAGRIVGLHKGTLLCIEFYDSDKKIEYLNMKELEGRQRYSNIDCDLNNVSNRCSFKIESENGEATVYYHEGKYATWKYLCRYRL